MRESILVVPPGQHTLSQRRSLKLQMEVYQQVRAAVNLVSRFFSWHLTQGALFHSRERQSQPFSAGMKAEWEEAEAGEHPYRVTVAVDALLELKALVSWQDVCRRCS